LSPLVGIALKIISTFAFLGMSTLVKLASPQIPIGELMFFRAFFALVPLGIWLWWTDELRTAVKTSRLGGHLVRSISGSGGMYFGFAALVLLPLPDATAIGYLAPIVATVLAALFLGEDVRFHRWMAVGVGFIGTLVMVAPHMAERDLNSFLMAGPALGALAGLAASACNGFSSIQIRKLAQIERTGTIVFYFLLVTGTIGLCLSIFSWHTPTAYDAALLISSGFLGGIGQILITSSYRFADASVIVSFEYTSLVWAVGIGYFLFGDIPHPAVFAGAVLVIASGLFIIFRERTLSQRRHTDAEGSLQKDRP
jgi:drug/metabolite transporter (DMT)-like permease